MNQTTMTRTTDTDEGPLALAARAEAGCPVGGALFIEFAERAERAAPIPALRARSYDALQLQSGTRVIDVGCRAGISVHEMAGLGANTIGIDPSRRMIELARNRFPDSAFYVADAEDVPLPSGSVDAYRADRVFQHLLDPQVAISEAIRVLAPGGRIALVDVDAESWGIHSGDLPLTRDLLRAYADTITTPSIGTALRALLAANGFTDLVIEPVVCLYTDLDDCAGLLGHIAACGLEAGIARRSQISHWYHEQRQLSQDGAFLAHTTMFLASGVRS